MLRLLILSVLFGVTMSIYDFKVTGLTGGTIDFSKYKGKKIMIVNTASKCGNTPQYADLEKLYEQYKDKLVIVGFPANNFGQQEPGTNADIKELSSGDIVLRRTDNQASERLGYAESQWQYQCIYQIIRETVMV